jgi:hypothetical protein
MKIGKDIIIFTKAPRLRAPPGHGGARGRFNHLTMISHENCILSDRIMGVETPITPIMTYAAAHDGAPPRRIND